MDGHRICSPLLHRVIQRYTFIIELNVEVSRTLPLLLSSSSINMIVTLTLCGLQGAQWIMDHV